MLSLNRSAITQWRPSPFTLGATLAIAVGVLTGLGSVAFRALLDLFHFVFFDLLMHQLSFMDRYAVVVIPASGALLVGLLVYFFAREAKGHGVPEVMLAVSRNGGRIRGRVSIVKALASALCISSGGSAGREGPIVQIGSSIASALGQRFGLSSNWLQVLVACGAAGGISATFNAPIAGTMFALEVILRTFSVRNFGVVVLSAVTALVVSQAFLGDSPAFSVPLYKLTSPWELGFYIILGILAAPIGIGFMRLLYLSEDVFDRLPVPPEYVKPVLGGLGVGAIGIFFPQVFGVGYDSIGAVLLGGSPNGDNAAFSGAFALEVLAALALLKILATSLTLGSGGSGGVFAPSLFIGAMSGSAIGTAFKNLFPGAVGATGAYGLVGMAAVFAGAAHAPITAIIIVFEMTRDYNIILPLMLAVVISTFLSRRISRDSIYTMKLTRRGIDLISGRRQHPADAILVTDIVSSEYPFIYNDTPLREIPEKFAACGVHGFPVLNHDSELVGIVTTTDVEHAMGNGFASGNAGDVATRSLIHAYTDQNILDVIAQPGAQEVGYFPVTTREEPRKLLGVLRRQDIIEAYAKAVNSDEENE